MEQSYGKSLENEENIICKRISNNTAKIQTNRLKPPTFYKKNKNTLVLVGTVLELTPYVNHLCSFELNQSSRTYSKIDIHVTGKLSSLPINIVVKVHSHSSLSMAPIIKHDR